MDKVYVVIRTEIYSDLETHYETFIEKIFDSRLKAEEYVRDLTIRYLKGEYECERMKWMDVDLQFSVDGEYEVY